MNNEQYQQYQQQHQYTHDMYTQKDTFAARTYQTMYYFAIGLASILVTSNMLESNVNIDKENDCNVDDDDDTHQHRTDTNAVV